ncbi:MAG: V4R domain-containing protein [Thermoplasmata archaeon]
MPVVLLTKADISELKRVIDSVMTVASHGIFYRAGLGIGNRIAGLSYKTNYFQEVGERLRKEGWLKEIKFGEDGTVIVKGSIEVEPSNVESCHILRGIIAAIYQKHLNSGSIYCTEYKCESMGSPNCEFRIETEVI